MSNEEIFQKMQQLVAEQFAMSPADITMATLFEEDLGADSVDFLELIMAMEEEFEIEQTSEEELVSLKSMQDVVNYIAARLNA